MSDLSPETEKTIIKELEEVKMMSGDTRYLITTKWLKSWKAYVVYDISMLVREESRPGPIDNTPIIEKLEGEKVIVKKNLYLGYDYETVSEDVWNKLVEWYSGGPPIPRPVVEYGFTKRLKVEVHPLKIQVVHNANPSETVDWEFSRATKLGDFKKTVCESLNVDASKIKIFRFSVRVKGIQLVKMENTLETELMGSDTSVLLFEEEGIESPQPSYQTTSYTPSSSIYSSTSTSYEYPSFSSSSLNSFKYKGLVGLRNLGNTCFMNSALQCLSNTKSISSFFISDKYQKEINTSNPFGMKGEIANSFGTLLKSLHSNQSAISPIEFKSSICKFAPVFSGFAQHDAQEFLAFLLDGLHEELSRGVNNSSDFKKEQPEQQTGESAYEAYISRNNSIITDNFLGFYKSKVCCPDCKKISITYDPFMYLTLPLPEPSKDIKKICVWSLNQAFPKMYALRLPQVISIDEFTSKVEELSCISSDSLVVAELIGSTISRLYTKQDTLVVNSGRSIVLYEVPKIDDEGKLMTLVKVQVFGNSKQTFSLSKQKLSAHPFVILCQCKSTVREVLLLCWKRVKHLFSRISLPDREDELLKVISQSVTLQMKVHLSTTKYDKGLNQEIHFSPGCTLLIKWKSQVFNKIDTSLLTKIEEDASVKYTKYDTTESSTTLENCFKDFVKEEQLSSNDLWFCSSCKKDRQATKKLDIYCFPKILVIHLKRFRSALGKVSTFVDFPIEGLDLSPYSLKKENLKYDLYGICNHAGSLGSGHYTAICKNEEANQWYLYNDNSVSEISESKLKSSSAYLLFYQRRDITTEE